MAKQAEQRRQQFDEPAAQPARRDSLHDGIGHRRISRPANDAEITRGSPWALAPWPTLEIAKWVADRADRLVPARGNRDVLAAAGSDAQARLEAVMHQCVIPALRAVHDQLVDEGYDVRLDYEATQVVLRTRTFNGRPIAYAVAGGIYNEPVFSLIDAHSSQSGRRYARISIRSRGTTRLARLEHCGYAAMKRDALHDLRNQMLY